jgi:glucose-6-phosphate isomerase
MEVGFGGSYLWNSMNVKRNKKNEVVVTLPANVDPAELQRMLDYLQYLALTAGSKATPAMAGMMAAEASAGIRKARRKQMAS